MASNVIRKLRSVESQNIIFCIAFFIYCMYNAMHRVYFASIPLNVNWTDPYFEMIVIVLLASKIVLQTECLRDFAAVPLILLGLATWNASHYPVVFLTMLFVASGKNIRIKPLVLISVLVFGGALLLSFLGVHLGFFTNLVQGRSSNRIGMAWGTNNVNSFALMLFTAGLSLSVLIPNKLSNFRCILLLFLALANYLITASRTFSLALAFSALCFFLYNRGNKNKEFPLRKVTAAAFLIFGLLCAAFSIGYMLIFNPNSQIDMLLNNLSSGRLGLNNFFYGVYGTSLFGSPFKGKMMTPYADVPLGTILDNGWVKLYILYGILSVAAYVGANIGILIKTIKENYYGVALVGFAACCIFGITEHFNIYFAYCPYWLLASPLVFKQSLATLDKPLLTYRRGAHSLE